MMNVQTSTALNRVALILVSAIALSAGNGDELIGNFFTFSSISLDDYVQWVASLATITSTPEASQEDEFVRNQNHTVFSQRYSSPRIDSNFFDD